MYASNAPPSASEVRAAAELRASGRRLVGYVARFDTEARIGTFTETIKPGAFRASAGIRANSELRRIFPAFPD